MSKEISDLFGRLNGDMIALQGMEGKISPPPPPPPVTIAQEAEPQPAPTKVKKEDYDHVKKLLEEVKGLCKNMEDQIDKEMKVPAAPGEEKTASSHEGAGAGSAHKK